MLRALLDFIKRERKYSIAFLVLVLLYGFFLTHQDKKEQGPEKTQILEKFKKAEDRVDSKVKEAGSLEAYLKDRPHLALALNVLTSLIFVALIAGLIVDYLFLSRPLWREKFFRHVEFLPFDWEFSLLFKFFIWFFGLNIVISFVLLSVRHFLHLSENAYLLLHTACAEILSFVVIFSLLRKQGGGIKCLGLSFPQGKWFREVLLGWTAYAGILPVFGTVLILLLVVIKLFNYEPPPHPLVPIFLEEGQRSPGIVVCSLFLAVVFGPIFEEIFFRGFCYPIFKKRFGSLTAMVVTSSFFAFIHDSTFAFWPIFILGMALNYLYEKRGSLIANITLHVTHNALFLTYFFLAKDIISREL